MMQWWADYLDELESNSGRVISIGGHAKPALYTRAEMGMVFQLSNLWPHLSVTENVAIAVRKVRGLPGREAKQLALEMLAKVHMTHRVHDEPTSALDPELGA